MRLLVERVGVTSPDGRRHPVADSGAHKSGRGARRQAGNAEGNDARAQSDRQWPSRHRARADFDPQARRPGVPLARHVGERANTQQSGRSPLPRKINASYVGRVLRLTLLAPDIVEAILGGRQPAEMTLAVLMKPFALAWREQRKILKD